MTGKKHSREGSKERGIAASLKKQIAYMQAEFENYKKSLDKRQAEFESRANERLVRNLLPLIDDLEAAVENAGDREAKHGHELVLKKLLDILTQSGLKQIESVGKAFDPYYHEAVMSVESEKPEGSVIEELQKGYLLNSMVIRHAKVKIVRNKKPRNKKEEMVST